MDPLSEINQITNLTDSLYNAMRQMPSQVNKINDNMILTGIIREKMQKLRDALFEEK